MSLTAADVAEIMRLLEQSSFNELNLEMEGIKLCLRRGAQAQPHPALGAEGITSTAPTSPSAGAQPTPWTDAVAASGTAAAAVIATPGASAPTWSPARAQPTSGTSATAGSPPWPATNMPAAPNAEAATAAVTPGAATAADPTIHEVASPLLGTFYRAPKPGAPPFVEVGSPVEEGTVVAIIEVMKLMNTVRAGTKGTVTEILLADGALAEYGQPLLRVRKAAG